MPLNKVTCQQYFEAAGFVSLRELSGKKSPAKQGSKRHRNTVKVPSKRVRNWYEMASKNFCLFKKPFIFVQEMNA